MVTPVVYENENKNIGARPLMLPLQQADICTATIYWLVTLREKLSMLDRKYGFKLVDMQEGQ